MTTLLQLGQKHFQETHLGTGINQFVVGLLMTQSTGLDVPGIQIRVLKAPKGQLEDIRKHKERTDFRSSIRTLLSLVFGPEILCKPLRRSRL